MACLPRFLRHRSKNSFNPREDGYTDPIVDNADNSVQIGRYIRREEKPLFSPILTPSPSEARLYKIPSSTTATTTVPTTQTQITVAPLATTDLATPAATHNENNLPHAPNPLNLTKIEEDVPKSNNNQQKAKTNRKKFISNKDKTLSKDSNNNSNGESSPLSSDVNGHAINVTRSNSKLKPVKGRRPTALPCEAPHFEDERLVSDVEVVQHDVVDVADTPTEVCAGIRPQLKVLVNGDGEIIAENGCTRMTTTTITTTTMTTPTLIQRTPIPSPSPSSTLTLTPTPTTASAPATPNTEEEEHKEHVQFFIGNGNNDESPHGHHHHHHRHRHVVDEVDSIDDVDGLHYSTTKATVSTSTLLPKPANGYLKSCSNASLNYLNGSQQQKARSDSVNRARFSRSVSTTHDIHIPPPPPMPTELLVLGTPLRKRKPTIKAARPAEEAHAADETATIGTAGTSVVPEPKNASTSSNESSETSHASEESKSCHAVASLFRLPFSATDADADPAKFTLAELLNADADTACSFLPSSLSLTSSTPATCSNDSYRSCSSATQTYNCHSVGSDSGVQSVDTRTPTATPKDSDQSAGTPKSHRVEGGLIFARPNLPTKKQIEIVFIEKDDATRNLIHTAIERNDFLNNLMDKERKEMVIKAMAPANYDKDSYIILEKEEGSEIYVSAEGYYDVIKDGKHVGNFGPATVFGELAILYNAPRQATIKAATNARVWKIARETFRAIMQISGSREREENLNFMRSAPFLKDLSASVLDKVVDLLQRKFYETNSCIVREGEVGNEFFIIRGGTVTIKKQDEKGIEHVVNRRRRGDFFGEQALLNADRRQASVYADPPGTEVLRLDRETFISYLGTIPQLRERPKVSHAEKSRAINRNAEFDNEHAHIPISELKKMATLGSGAFGRVDLVTHGKKIFALKIIKKIEIVKADQIEHVYNEKNVMIKCRSSPFIVELYRTYRNDKFIYFLMEACMGGDVWTIMSRRQHFDDKTATFIAACVVEAFDYLHSHNFVYRDLKPENLMLTTDGYCKLGDFGFAKHVRPNEKTNTFAGTPEYVAPEIILDRGHDRAVDYWALGILIFELLVGKTPFRGYNQIKIYQQILSGIDVIHMPSRIPKSAQGLIKHLCKQLPAERLGYQRRGIQDIKRHSWFDGIDWAKLKSKQFVSPIKRPINSSTDLQYFEKSVIENDYEPPDELSGWDKDF